MTEIATPARFVGTNTCRNCKKMIEWDQKHRVWMHEHSNTIACGIDTYVKLPEDTDNENAPTEPMVLDLEEYVPFYPELTGNVGLGGNRNG